MADSLLAVPGIENLGPDGRRAIVSIASSLGTNPDFLVTIGSFESAHSFAPSKRNPSGATGIIQIMPSTAKKLGTTTDAIAKLSQEAYILGPMYQYFLPFKGRLKTLEDTYLAVFFPAAMGQSDSYVVGIKEGGTAFQAAVYKQNAGFDSGNTGKITRGDIVRTIRSVYNAGKAKGRVPVPPGPTFLKPIVLIPLLLATSAAAAGYVYFHNRRWS